MTSEDFDRILRDAEERIRRRAAAAFAALAARDAELAAMHARIAELERQLEELTDIGDDGCETDRRRTVVQ